MNKKTTLAVSALALFGGVLTLPLFNFQDASAVAGGPSPDLTIDDKCIYTETKTKPVYNQETKEWEDKPYVCDGVVEGVSYDVANNVLTLDNVKIDGKIYLGTDVDGVIVDLVGENSAKGLTTQNDKISIVGDGSLTLDTNIFTDYGAQTFTKIDIDGPTLSLKNGYIYAHTVTIKNSTISITNKVKCSQDTQQGFDCTGITASSTLVVDNSNVEITAEVPVFAGQIKIQNASLDNGLKILTGKKKNEGAQTEAYMYTYYTTIADDKTKFVEPTDDEPFYLFPVNRFKNYPTSIRIITDIIEGANQEMKKEAIKDIVIRYDRDISLFEKLAIDGKELPQGSYTLASGSTIVAIKAEYVKNLNVGIHEIAAYFKGEEKPIETSLKITETPVVPETGGGEEDNKRGEKSPNSGAFTENASTVAFPIVAAVMAGLTVSAGAFRIFRKYSEASEEE